MSTSVEQDHTSATIVDQGKWYEVVAGERVELEPMGAYEIALAAGLWRHLTNFVTQHELGLVVSEMLFVLDAEAKLKRRPDVAFVSFPRWPEQSIPRAEAWNVVPDLAIEIISPTNQAEEIDGKIVEYFEAGVRLVWVLYPDTGRVYVYESASRIEVIERTGELDGGEVLAGFRLPIQTIFDAVTRPN